MAEIDVNETLRPYWSALLSKGRVAPKAALLALFALIEKPTAIFTVELGSEPAVAWQIIALDERGVAIVEAGSPTAWAWESRDDPKDRVLRAVWHPLDHVTAVGITAIERPYEPMTNPAQLIGQETWAVTIAGREFSLDTRGAFDAGDPAALCRALQGAMSRRG